MGETEFRHSGGGGGTGTGVGDARCRSGRSGIVQPGYGRLRQNARRHGRRDLDRLRRCRLHAGIDWDEPSIAGPAHQGRWPAGGSRIALLRSIRARARRATCRSGRSARAVSYCWRARSTCPVAARSSPGWRDRSRRRWTDSTAEVLRWSVPGRQRQAKVRANSLVVRRVSRGRLRALVRRRPNAPEDSSYNPRRSRSWGLSG